MKQRIITRLGSELVASSLILSLAQPVFAAGHAAKPQRTKAPAAAPAHPAAPSPPAEDPALAAEARAKAEALALKNQGDTLFRSRDFGAAISSYQRSYAVYPDARVLFNHARALQALGRYSESLALLQRFADAAGPEIKAEVSGLPELQADLRSRVAEVVIHVNEPETAISFRNQPLNVGAAGEPVLLDAGEGLLRVTKPG